MFPNPGPWAWHFRNVFVPAVEAFQRGVFEKVIPAFANIADEADAFANAEFERLGAMSATDHFFDMRDVAEWANEAGINYSQTMTDVRQGMLNVLAIGLHHLLEQQQRYFLSREALPRGQKPSSWDERLRAYGIEVREFPCASRMRELRAAANALKHASAEANQDLVSMRPDLFVSPHLARLGTSPEHRLLSAQALSRGATMPMSGEHVYVQENDLADWCAAVVDYWQTLSKTLTDAYGHASLG